MYFSYGGSTMSLTVTPQIPFGCEWKWLHLPFFSWRWSRIFSRMLDPYAAGKVGHPEPTAQSDIGVWFHISNLWVNLRSNESIAAFRKNLTVQMVRLRFPAIEGSMTWAEVVTSLVHASIWPGHQNRVESLASWIPYRRIIAQFLEVCMTSLIFFHALQLSSAPFSYLFFNPLCFNRCFLSLVFDLTCQTFHHWWGLASSLWPDVFCELN
jgi:hypothetical protein